MEEATTCLENYKTRAMELNGPDFDWLHSPVDVRALYHCSCIRRHGKWAIFNRIVNDKVALAELKRSHASMDAQRQHQEEENQMRKEARDSCMAKDFAQRMFEWGRIVHDHYDNMRRFMEAVALHSGMPATSIPPLLPPMLQPATYGVSPSPCPSLENAGTFGSCIRGETPEETLSRIAYGGFGVHVNANGGSNSPPMNATNNNDGGPVNATTSGGANYSLEADGVPLF